MNARSQSEFGHPNSWTARPISRTVCSKSSPTRAKFKPTTESGRAFFQIMRDYTVVGYYTTKLGLESIGYPGLRSRVAGHAGLPAS